MLPHQQYSPEHTVSSTTAVRVYTVHRHGVAVEADTGLLPNASRARIRSAVEARYTLPA